MEEQERGIIELGQVKGIDIYYDMYHQLTQLTIGFDNGQVGFLSEHGYAIPSECSPVGMRFIIGGFNTLAVYEEAIEKLIQALNTQT